MCPSNSAEGTSEGTSRRRGLAANDSPFAPRIAVFRSDRLTLPARYGTDSATITNLKRCHTLGVYECALRAYFDLFRLAPQHRAPKSDY